MNGREYGLFQRPRRGPALVQLGLLAFLGLACAPSAFALDPEASASSYNVRGWQTESGLPSNKVRAITQTTDGYIWVATEQGLARFDGNRFEIFNHSTHPLFSPGYYYALAETPDHVLWIGSDDGLYSLDRGQLARFSVSEGLPSNFVRSLNVERDGTVLIGTKIGISSLQQGRFNNYATQVDGNVRALIERPDGSYFIAGENGLWQATGKQLEKLSGTPRFPGSTFTCFLQAPDGKLWIGSNIGLQCVHPDGHVEMFGPSAGLTNVRVQCLKRDRDGNLWIGTNGGLFRFTNGRIEAALYPKAFGASTVVDICEDREGGLWVASFIGLYQLSNSSVQTVGLAQGLKDSAIHATLASRDGTWWIGSWGGGVYNFDPRTEKAVSLATPSKLRLDQIESVYEEADGTLWIGAYAGLFRRTGDVITNFYLQENAPQWRERLAGDPNLALPGLVHSRVHTVVSDLNGGIWIGTEGALYHARDGQFRIVPAGGDSPTGRVSGPHSVLQSRDGTLWAAAPGVAQMKDGQWKLFGAADGFTATRPRSIFEDSAGAIWITTEGEGLNRYKDGRWKNYTTQQGLIDNYCISIIEDEGFFWIGTSRGIMRIALKDFDALDGGRLAVLSPKVITKSDGLPIAECNRLGSPNAEKTRDGRLLFPTDAGVAVIDPRRVTVNTTPPPVYIEHLLVNNRDVDLAKSALIPAGHTNLEFRYTAISLPAPEKVRFKIKLTPFDATWRDIGIQRDIRYPRLTYGDYTFQVIACNADGVWNEQGATLAFTVSPFFYQTLWFRAALAAVAGGIIVGSFRWRVRVLRKHALDLQRQNVELERRVAERTATLAERSNELAKSYETLRSSEYFYHSLVESLPQIIVRKDATSRFTYANSGFGELLGRPLGEIIGKTDLDFYPPERAAQFRADDQRIMATRQMMEYESVVEKNGAKRYLHVKKVPLYDEQKRPIGVQMLFWDMTVFREMEEKLKEAQKKLIETSRLAGMAEVATGVLHNIGNALNSVNVSATIAMDRTRALKTQSIIKVAQLLTEHGDRLVEFFTADARGSKVPGYLTQLGESLQTERDEAVHELETLRAGIDQLRAIVAAHENYARVSELKEIVPAVEFVESALAMSEASLTSAGIRITREFTADPRINVQRQKIVQLLLSLFGYAREALEENGRADKKLILRLSASPDGNVQIAVTHTGAGIAPENLTRIFAADFSTDGIRPHFDLHGSALVAKEHGGSLTAQSAGPEKGATFLLELPAAQIAALPS